MPAPDSGGPSPLPLTIEKVEGPKALDQFIRVPWHVFKDDPHWVPPLLIERKGHLDPKQNPYFDHAKIAMWIARKGDQVVGRISAQVDDNYLAHHKDDTGQFGFLDAIDDPQVFKALTLAAEAWLRDQGMHRVVGPFSLSINDEAGMLIEGFDSPPFVMMGHAHPYYQTHVEALGYHKAQDLIAYGYEPLKPLDTKIERMLTRLENDPQIRIRTLDKGQYEADIRVVLDIFNDAWSENWGFVPFTERELAHIAKELKPLIREELVVIVEVEGEPVAMGVAFPNLNEAIADLDGSLLPFGWVKLLWRLKVTKLKSLRLALMGVAKKHHNTILGSSLGFGIIGEIRKNAQALGITSAELGWVLEDNTQMWRMIETVGGTREKLYRVFEKDLV
jgi:hypothetical protein